MLTISFLLLVIFVYSQTNYAPIAFNSFLFPSSTRSIGLGGAGTALSADASAINLNPARLSLIDEKVNFSLDSYTFPSIKSNNNSKYVSAKYVLNKKNNSLGIGINSYSLGEINQVSEAGGSQAISLSNEYKISIAESLLITDKSSIGISIDYINKNKLLYSSIPGISSIMGAIGYLYKTSLSKKADRELMSGVTIENIGAKTKDGYFLPTTFSIGTTYMQGYNEITTTTFPFFLGVEFSKLLVPSLPIYDTDGKITKGKDPRDISGVGTIFQSFFDDPNGKNLDKWRVQIYSEINLLPEFSIRTGYSTENKVVGNRNYFTIGLGYVYKNDKDLYNLDLGYIIPTDNSQLGNLYKNVLSFSLKYKMGSKW
jgi:Type IX secretion system protein PorV